MKGKLLLMLCLLLLLSYLSYTRFSQTVSKASSGSPVHNLNTGLNYTTIKDAINANETSNGQTILVDDGTYYENVVVNKSLTLIGESRDDTIVDANGTGDAFTLTVPNVSLINFTVVNSSIVGNPIYGNIFLNQTTNCRIENVETSNCRYAGVALLNSSHNTISGCYSSANGLGIFLWDSDENTVRGNVISGNHLMGIALWGEVGSNSNVLDDNEVSSNTDNGFDITGINNSVNSNLLCSNMVGIVLDNANFTTVYGNEISNNMDDGVWLVNAAYGKHFLREHNPRQLRWHEWLWTPTEPTCNWF